MANDFLTKFANELYARAIEEKKDIAEKLKKESDEILEKTDKELNEKFSREVEKYYINCKNEVLLGISKRDAELSSALRHNRARAAEEVFAEAKKRLEEFTLSDGYKDYLIREFEGVASEFSGGVTVCTAKAGDFGLIKKISLIDNLEMKEEKDNIIGGFTLKNTELKIFADCTLRSKLEEQKDRFFEISGLVIE